MLILTHYRLQYLIFQHFINFVAHIVTQNVRDKILNKEAIANSDLSFLVDFFDFLKKYTYVWGRISHRAWQMDCHFEQEHPRALKISDFFKNDFGLRLKES